MINKSAKESFTLMQNLPFYVYLVFGATVLIAIWLIYKASNYSKPFLIAIIAWIGVQSFLGVMGFYNNPNNMTSRFPLLILPTLLLLFITFITKDGRKFIDRLNLEALTIFHFIRIPVEIILFWLCIHKSIPEAMTFKGRNFDIFSGISAPFFYYFGFIKKKISKSFIITWNFICLLLLLNVVANALLSLPDRYQLFGFEVPNIALGYFPFLLLPACLVPLVIFSTLASIRILYRRNKL